MKRISAFAVLTVFIILLTGCNNVNKPAYNGNLSNGFLQADSELSSTANNIDIQNINSNGYVDGSSQSSSIVHNEEMQNGSSVIENSSGENDEVTSTPIDHTHEFDTATCTAPKTCSVCGATEGEPLGHRWAASNCMYPKTCIVCETSDNKLGKHIYINGICNICGGTDPDFKYVPLNSKEWVANMIDDTTLHQFIISSNSKTNYYIGYSKYEAASDTADYNKKSTYRYNGVKYVKTNTSAKNTIKVEEVRNYIYITDAKGRSLVLKRITEDVIRITEADKNFGDYEEFLRADMDFRAENTQ